MKKNVPIYQNAAGPVPISMTNDYLFKALLQKNEKVLRALICSLLHLKPEDLWDIQITNPIILGESINDKDIVLDVNVSFNT
ncbi:MAG: PD-(D/E)XK nuclease family transposase [Lachnospiraceae bacterium]|nr:PD-(D/E)XK nuclease family transposase [Lachnospiraceae bacterium]